MLASKPGQRRYVIVTPVRDEARYVGNTLASVGSQTILPCQWVIVNDGSGDATGEIVERYAAGRPWMTIIHRQDRGYRSAGGGVIDAFNAGYANVRFARWNYIVKLDGDLSFASDYFERCFERFEADARLGIAGGTIYRVEQGGPVIDSAGDPAFHVRGATKIYRRACWNRIAPLPAAPGWDTIDEVEANLRGFHTRTFADLQVIQHKPTGAADGTWRNAFKNGRANYLAGYHPLFMLAKCIRRASRAPLSVEPFALIAGFLSGYFKKLPHEAGDDVVRYLREQQIRRLFLRPSIYQ